MFSVFSVGVPYSINCVPRYLTDHLSPLLGGPWIRPWIYVTDCRNDRDVRRSRDLPVCRELWLPLSDRPNIRHRPLPTISEKAAKWSSWLRTTPMVYGSLSPLCGIKDISAADGICTLAFGRLDMEVPGRVVVMVKKL